MPSPRLRKMAKGKVKNSNDSLAQPQPRSPRSRKRECPSDEVSGTDDDVQANYQDTERNNSAVDATLPQYQHALMQESTMTSATRHQAAEQSCLTKQEHATEEKHAEATNVSSKDVMGKAQQKTTVTNPNNDSQPEGFIVHTDNDANQSGKDKEEITVAECNRSPSQTCTDQLQVLLATSEEGNGSRSTALEEQLCAKENSQCNLERNHVTSQEECSTVSIADVKEVTKETEVLLPAKKKRRMGMCGLTGKERSHFLQKQKCENGQNRLEGAEKQNCNNTADLMAQEEIISSPPLPFSLSIPSGSVTEQNEAELQLRSSHCEGDYRAEAEVHSAVTTSDGTSAVCDSGCSKGQSCEAEEGTVEQTGDTKADPPAEEELLGNQEQQELDESTAESVAQKPQQQMKDGGDGSVVADQIPAISFYSNPPQNRETETWDAIEAAPLQVNSVTRTRDKKKEELTCDAGDSASSTDTRSGGLSKGPVELCEAAVSPGGSERKDSCDHDDEPGARPSTLNAERHQTRNTIDPFGSGCLDYVSDSQLNTITLTEEEVMEREEDLGSPDCHDATDLICGLIRELSSLNQKVMAAHRELENLRRSSKSSRSSIR